MRRVLLVLLVLLPLTACDSRRTDSLEVFAASSCGILQSWIDAVEDETVALSRAVTPLDDASERVGHYRLFATAADLRAEERLLGRD